MTAFILRAGKYARIGGIIVQALTLVVSITEHLQNRNGGAKQPSDHDPEDGA